MQRDGAEDGASRAHSTNIEPFAALSPTMYAWTVRLNTIFFFALSVLGYMGAGNAITGLFYSMNPSSSLSATFMDMYTGTSYVPHHHL
jgi:hypothetical protein